MLGLKFQETHTVMKQPKEISLHQDEMLRDIRLLLSLLPPPVSLDILCAVTAYPPVKVLQMVEALVRSGLLCRYREKGAGYYYLADPKTVAGLLTEVPEPDLAKAAKKALAGVYGHLPDG